MTYSTTDANSPAIRITSSDEDVRSAVTTTADELLRQALEILGRPQRPVGEFAAAVKDYQRRVAEGNPYEDTIDREEFRRRFGV